MGCLLSKKSAPNGAFSEQPLASEHGVPPPPPPPPPPVVASNHQTLTLDLTKVQNSDTGPTTGRRKKVPPPSARGGHFQGAQSARKTVQMPTPTPRVEEIQHVRQEDLPYYWQRCETKDGKVYYFNSSTSETQWHPPSEDNDSWSWDPSKERDQGANSWAR